MEEGDYSAAGRFGYGFATDSPPLVQFMVRSAPPTALRNAPLGSAEVMAENRRETNAIGSKSERRVSFRESAVV